MLRKLKINHSIQSLFLAPDLDSDECFVKCPECGHDYIHMGKPVWMDGKDDYSAHPNVRGSVISFECGGECEHNFSLFFGFHKGRIVCWTEMLSPNKKVNTF